jgi:hypothetical protein
MQRVLRGLHAATPKGVSYTCVELDETGTLRLTGRSSSLALPFILPERLEALDVFKQVVLLDAGQSHQSDGSAIRFRLTGRLEETAP